MDIALLAGIALLCGDGSGKGARAHAEQLFNVVDATMGTTASPANVYLQIKKLAPKSPDDVRVKYAYVVVLVQQKRHGEALVAVESLVANDPDYLPAHRARVWLLMVLHKEREALQKLESLAANLSQSGAAHDAEEECLEAARFLGLAMGYLREIGSKSVTAKALDACQSRVLDRLTESNRKAFDAGLGEARSRFAEVADAPAPSAADQKRSQDLAGKEAGLDKLRADAKQQSQTVEQQLLTYWEKLREEWNRASTSYEELARQAYTLEQRRIPIHVALSDIESRIKDAERNKNNSERDSLHNKAIPLRASDRQLRSQIALCTQTMNQLMAYGAAIQTEMAQVSIEGQRIGMAFKEQEQEIKRQANVVSQRKRKHESAVATKTRQQGERQRAFAEFAEFSYELEKKRVLDALATQ